MDAGFVDLTLLPLRAEPDDRSEMVSQLLFGESWTMLQEMPKWIQIRCAYDGYEGFIDRKQARFRKEGPRLATPPAEQQACSLELVHSASSASRHVALVLGSTLPHFDGMNLRLEGEKLVYHGQATDPAQPYPDPVKVLAKMGQKFLGAPYLWGGRSPFGIDCSGLVQVLYKVLGIALPRDAKDQIAFGESVDFAHAAKAGDLAFFDNEEGLVTHVGMVLEAGKILHASGQVRIDALDQQGIYNAEQQGYTHRLRLIKRML